MTRQDKLIVAAALAPNFAAVLALFGWMAWRMASGAPPMPRGAAPVAIFFCCLTPMATIVTASFLRLRRPRRRANERRGATNPDPLD